MKSWAPLNLTLLLFILSWTCHAAQPTPEESWLEAFRLYSAQPNQQVEYSYTGQRNPEQKIWLTDILRKLPDPHSWPALRDQLGQAAARETEPRAKKRLQAGKWLLSFMLGDRDVLQGEICGIISTDPDEPVDGESYAAKRLFESVASRSEEVPLQVSELKSFEESLASLEPIDEAEVKGLMGEENFQRAERFKAGVLQFNARIEALFEEAEKSADSPDTDAKREQLAKEFADRFEGDRQVLELLRKEPRVERYLSSRLARKESGYAGVTSLYVPDLVAIAGREKAEQLFQRALKLPLRFSLGRDSSATTRRLVSDLALRSIDALKVPSWGLMRSEEQWPLFEALRKKFPVIDPAADGYAEAQGFYLEHLIMANRLPEAVKLAVERPMIEGQPLQAGMTWDSISRLERSSPESLWDFWREWLTAKPAAEEWDYFIRLSAQLDRRQEMQASVSALVDRGTFHGLDRLRLEQLLANTELAAGDIDQAIDRLREMLSALSEDGREREQQWAIAQRLLQLADLRNDRPLHALAQASMEARLATERDLVSGPKPGNAATLASLLNQGGYFADALRVSRTMIEMVAKTDRDFAENKTPSHGKIMWSESVLQNLLGEELRSLVELKQWSAARVLLLESPYWGAQDLAQLLDLRVASSDVPFGYYAARVALASGEAALGRKLLEAQLLATPAVDPVYAAYLEVAGRGAVPLLDKLSAADRYEERPLIWKGQLQVDAGDWDAAIATLEQALRIDPSDGEQGRGDRMRVYAVLSKAAAGKQDRDKAEFYARVVKSIRISETADRWLSAGAYGRAIELYREALGFFSEAYCIQSRLALRLADEGKMTEAAEHYRRAFELMPESFGRVESHCFGCEQVFATEKSQEIAGEVFARLLQAQPDQPQLHYLSGYLREEEQQFAAAAEDYQAAVRLDPLYLNAWKRLAGLDEKLQFTSEQRDEILLRLAELDPGERHSQPDLAKVHDIPRLWRTLAAIQRQRADLPRPVSLWKLPASAARMENSPNYTAVNFDRRFKDAATVVLGQRFVESWQEYLASLSAELAPP